MSGSFHTLMASRSSLPITNESSCGLVAGEFCACSCVAVRVTTGSSALTIAFCDHSAVDNKQARAETDRLIHKLPRFTLIVAPLPLIFRRRKYHPAFPFVLTGLPLNGNSPGSGLIKASEALM